MTYQTNDAFAFDFSAVSISDNPIDTFPFDVPLLAQVTDVAYKNLAKKDSGETNMKLVITQKVWHDGKEARFETMISPKQAYILKSYLVAAGIDADALSDQRLTADELKDALSGPAYMLTTTANEWQGKSYRNFKRIVKADEGADEIDLPF